MLNILLKKIFSLDAVVSWHLLSVTLQRKHVGILLPDKT
jgi:hypothetical protein